MNLILPAVDRDALVAYIRNLRDAATTMSRAGDIMAALHRLPQAPELDPEMLAALRAQSAPVAPPEPAPADDDVFVDPTPALDAPPANP